ncbi:hypothetical protein DA798_10240 [Lactobacillus sp. PFC-70]|nr:hypothetical protein DA798_10240 [Lactobacillus sp. PFC-70]
MSSELMDFSDRLHFLRKWLLLLILGTLIGGGIGFLLRGYASKTTYTYNVGIEVSHPYKKGMSKEEFRSLKLADTQNAGQYAELVKSSGILSAVNDRLHSQYGIVINNVDLAQMYAAGQYSPEGGFYIACTSSSKKLAKIGLTSMTKQIKQSMKWADRSVKVKTFETVYFNTLKVQKGVKSALIYGPLVGFFLALLLSIVLDSFGRWRGIRNVIRR